MYWELYNSWIKRKEILNNAREYVKKIKEICLNDIDKDCRVILFGSVAKGNFRVDSDIDVLIITEKAKSEWDRAMISSKIKERLGFGDPLELHVISKKEYDEWYKRFLDVFEEF
jgi:predicted nucleotidyltransferase